MVMKINLDSYPQEVQFQIKGALKAFDTVHVYFENGEYQVSPHVCLKSQYAPDHRFISSYSACEVYSREDRITNYMESFNSSRRAAEFAIR
ncbi:hypothetical protein AGMMS4952_11110 [Spirochaetia bacterium]|nr:hypothetical protein AGMMS4952_11110 [Spirochaetia bacterium]